LKKIGIITGTTRQGRKSKQVAEWVTERASKTGEATYEVLDLADFNLPLLQESAHPAMGEYQLESTKRWAKAVEGYDGFIFVTAEYNRSVPAALKNALDTIYGEWGGKPAAFVSYGGASGGMRAVEHLRQITLELRMLQVHDQVSLPFGGMALENPDWKEDDNRNKQLDSLVGELESMHALVSVRA
jgi:NAD(P)H-dependent FMN reductase